MFVGKQADHASSGCLPGQHSLALGQHLAIQLRAKPLLSKTTPLRTEVQIDKLNRESELWRTIYCGEGLSFHPSAALKRPPNMRWIKPPGQDIRHSMVGDQHH